MSDYDNQYEELQRYHVYNVGGDDTYCRDEDVAELEAKYCKLLEEHRVMKQALKWIADDNYTHFKKRQIAIKTLQYVEVMP